MNDDDNQKPGEQPQQPEEFDVGSLADSLLAKEEDKKDDEKPGEENKGEEEAKPGAEDKKDSEKPGTEEKPEDKKDDGKDPAKPKDDDAAKDGDEKPADSAKDEEKPGASTEEAAKPLTREDIRAAMREEEQAREQATQQRQTFAGQVRNDLKEALKLDSTYTTVALDDGTPISSVDQLTQVINPATEEPYTREEAATLLLEARKIVDDNIVAYEKRVDELTDLNVDFKEQADEVDRKYGDILKAFPDVAKDLLEAYRKTFKTSEDGTYVTDVPIPPLEFYAPVLNKFRNAADQVAQTQTEEKAAQEKAEKEAKIKAEQEDRSDLGGTAGEAKGKPDLLGDALTKYLAQ